MNNRCSWANNDDLMRLYHDTEWGVPVHDDRKLFEFMVLDGFQAGLSWSIVLKKRNAFRKAFDNFNILKVAGFDQTRVEEILSDTGIVRNRLKVNAAVQNARATLKICEEFGSLDSFLWKFTGNKTIRNNWVSLSDIPAVSPESEAMSRELGRRGFKFVGPTICYAFMQAAGMVNDHLVDCFRYLEV
jgi:DNA-3-methyladenine glycosylase I